MRDLIERSELFDAEWYDDQYPDVRLTGMSPIDHYIAVGASLLRDPGPDFSTSFYLAENPDVLRAGVNPLGHYEAKGRQEERRTAPSGQNLAPELPEFPVPRYPGKPPTDRPARVISFYLPQFHTIPENDQWWGKGFTEWTNVRRAKPVLPRHHQPHVPADLGYYDLRESEVQRRQIELAKLYGVEAFCFYFYWFAGKRLLETPIRNYLDDPSLDFPFLLCWANENWTRRWDGREQDVLIAQEYSPEDDLAFIAHVAEYMRDPRYLRVDGKPMLLVYRPKLLPDPSATVARWRTWCRENGIGEIHLAYTQSFLSWDPREHDFDAAIEFPPNNSGVPVVNPRVGLVDYPGRVCDWTSLVERSYSYPSLGYPLYRGVCPSWDNTARRGVQGTILLNSSPGRFARWTANAIRDMRRRFSPDERFVFVNAWNEWAEGAHLEPDAVFGYAWLESVRVALACATEPLPLERQTARVAVLVEVDGADVSGLVEVSRRIGEDATLLVTCADAHEDGVRRALGSTDCRFEVVGMPSGDSDWAPLHAAGQRLTGGDFDVVLRVGAGSPAEFDPREFLELALDLFVADPRLGVVYPETERVPASDVVMTRAATLGDRLGLTEDETDLAREWRGSAFAARVNALAPLAVLTIADEAFRPGSLEYDDALAPAFDRTVALSATAAGFQVRGADDVPGEAESASVVIVSHDAHPHGAQRLALNMASGYRAMGFDVHLVVLGGGELLDRFGEVATVHRVDLSSDPASRTLRMLKSLRAQGAQVAVANTTVSGALVPLLRQAGFSVVSLIHELPGILEDYGLELQAQSIADEAHRVVFPAEIVRQGFERFSGRQLENATIRPQGLYLHNPHRSDSARDEVRAAIRSELGLAPDARILLGVGYADHRKGLDLFLEAATRVMSSAPHAVAVWVGKSGVPDLLESGLDRLRAAGLADRFTLTGNVDNPEDYFTASDVFLLTSREDPFPSVVMEAMDAEVPVVAFSGATGSEDLIGRGAGVLVPAFDTAALADATLALLADPASGAAIGATGRNLIEREFGFRDYLYDLAELAGRPIPKVSVIVPNFNYADFVVQRLETIVRQTAPIHELIVLDDASTDASVARIREFLDGLDLDTRLVVNDQNSGSVFRQWQRGLAMATGDFVWIAEADDLADPAFLSGVLPAFDDPDVVLSYSQSRQMASDGSILSEDYIDYVSDIDRARWSRPYVVDGVTEIREALFLKNTIPNVSAVVFRREALAQTLAEHGDEIMSYRNAGDWVAYVRLLEDGKVAFTPRSLNSHRRHESSVTVSNFNRQQLEEIVKVQREVAARHPLDDDAASSVETYAQRLYEQFGLATPEQPLFREDPVFRGMRDEHEAAP